LLGRVFTKVNNPSQATPEYNKVRGYWKDPPAALKKLDALGGSEDEKIRRLGKSLTAVGEALFFFAELKKKEVDKIKFPEYKGSGTRDDVLKHINVKVMDWIKKKRPAIEETSNEYVKIVNLEPIPPPKWVIAAGSRVGKMWSTFVAEFRAAPIPKEWKGNGMVPGTDLSFAELRGEYYAKLDEASEPQKQAAKAAYKKCLDYSVKYQFFDEYSRQCEIWLSKNYGAEYHLIDEFRGAPSRVNSGLSDRAMPVNLDGSPFIAVDPAAAKADDKPAAAKPGESAEKAAIEGATTKPKK
jgi:hypothetical protein